MKNQNYEPIRDYMSFEDFLKKAGYKPYKPKVGVIGRALIEASKNHRSVKWLKNHLDSYFRKIRQQKRKFNDKRK